MDPAAIGRRLRELRERKGMSLRALAAATGTALSYLSALERDRSAVTVAKLKVILEAMGTTLGTFFAGAPSPAAKVVYRAREIKEISGQKRGLSYRDVAAGRPGRALQLLIETYAPGADTGPGLYRHDADEAGIVLRGRLELTVEEEVHVLGPGDAFYFDSRRPHRFRNAGRAKTVAVSVNAPPSF